MAINYYAGWSEEDLLKEQRRAQERLSRGSVVEAGAAGVRSVKKYEVSADIVLENLSYALYLLSPAKYPLQLRDDRTKAVIYG